MTFWGDFWILQRNEKAHLFQRLFETYRIQRCKISAGDNTDIDKLIVGKTKSFQDFIKSDNSWAHSPGPVAPVVPIAQHYGRPEDECIVVLGKNDVYVSPLGQPSTRLLGLGVRH